MGRFTTNGETHLPVHNEKHQTVDVYPCEETPDAVREKMPNPEGGAFTWSVRRPTYGPATLALKNRKSRAANSGGVIAEQVSIARSN